jgi:hypothetical protein
MHRELEHGKAKTLLRWIERSALDDGSCYPVATPQAIARGTHDPPKSAGAFDARVKSTGGAME